MKKTIAISACVILVLGIILSTASYAEEKPSAGQKFSSFWQKLFNYPANVTKESVNVVAETSKKSTEVVTKEVRTTGQVVTGDVAKTKELVTEPITGTAETAAKAVEGTVNVPVAVAKEEPAKTK